MPQAPYTPAPLPDDEAIAILTTILSDRKTELPVHIDIPSAYYLVTALQLATRHPGIGKALRRKIISTGRQFQEAIAAVHPVANIVLEPGWHEQFDVPIEDEGNGT